MNIKKLVFLLCLLITACATTKTEHSIIEVEQKSSNSKLDMALNTLTHDAISMKSKRYMCNETIPDNGHNIDNAFSTWFKNNNLEITALKKYWSTKEDHEYSAREAQTIKINSDLFYALSIKHQQKYCRNFFSMTDKGLLDFKVTAPNESTLAISYLENNPLSKIESDKFNFANDCKQSYSKGNIGLGRFNLMCYCMSDELFKIIKSPETVTFNTTLSSIMSTEQESKYNENILQCMFKKKFDIDVRL